MHSLLLSIKPQFNETHTGFDGLSTSYTFDKTAFHQKLALAINGEGGSLVLPLLLVRFLF